ncbi:MAG: helix-turn-helix domain-containing protein [Halobacteria archaeon]
MATETQTFIDDPVGALECLGDEYSLQILSVTLNDEKSAKDISDVLDIPIATVYRRIESLVEAGFLEYEGKQLTNEDKRVKMYQSYLDEVKVTFEGGEPRIMIDKHTDAQRTIDQAWRNLRE